MPEPAPGQTPPSHESEVSGKLAELQGFQKKYICCGFVEHQLPMAADMLKAIIQVAEDYGYPPP